jgi:glycosyltransferase involved in cell wall biosynthesis
LEYEVQVRAWAREFERADAARADVALLHHLTPLHEALARIAPRVPVVGVLHGTELLMLERIDAGAPPGWRHAARWAERLRGWARRCATLLVSPGSVERAAAVLGVAADRLVAMPSGVDVDVFAPRRVDRTRVWTDVLVRRPQGWLPDQSAGSVRYTAGDVERMAGAVVLLCVGRFTAVKRLDMLISAFAQARARARRPAALVLVGGHPGEWEGEHPAQTVDRLAVPDVYLAGWHDHERLPELCAAADVLVTTSAREQFGLVLVEAMACGLPVVATRSLGPELIVEDGETGWLVDADDPDRLVDALVSAVDDEPERQRRGKAARALAGERYSWDGITTSLTRLLTEVAGPGRDAPVAGRLS